MKVHTTISMDEELLKLAKERGINLSGTIDYLLKEKLKSKKNLPEDNLVIICSLCKKQIEEGFVCWERNIVLCNKCQEDYPMRNCPHKDGEHIHQKWPNMWLEKEKVEKIQNGK